MLIGCRGTSARRGGIHILKRFSGFWFGLNNCSTNGSSTTPWLIFFSLRFQWLPNDRQIIGMAGCAEPGSLYIIYFR
jgi:hypothetical protein